MRRGRWRHQVDSSGDEDRQRYRADRNGSKLLRPNKLESEVRSLHAALPASLLPATRTYCSAINTYPTADAFELSSAAVS